jgi:predicted short-subunit dehydrogenase-like oxidoreductase (DUF2520 family)
MGDSYTLQNFMKNMGAGEMKIGFIGAGKVGIAIAHVLKNKGFNITAVADVTGEKALDRARHYLGEGIRYTSNNMDVIEVSDIVAITTQDGAIREVTKEIFERAERLDGKLIFHTSGAHPSSILKPLDEKGTILGSLHPLQTFPDIDNAIRVLPNTYIFIEGVEEARQMLEILAKSIGCSVIPIEGKHKVYYHLCAVFVCNLLCSLLYAGEEIMSKIDITLEPFFPIINATMQNIESGGPLMSLTGPIVRGDIETLESHINALNNMDLHKQIYKALSLTALNMVKERKIHSQETLDALQRILGAFDE